MLDRTYPCLGLAGLLIAAGTLATGLLPSTAPYQVLAGGIIVAGFALVYACIGVGLDALDGESDRDHDHDRDWAGRDDEP